jgi:hypothetical protein
MSIQPEIIEGSDLQPGEVYGGVLILEAFEPVNMTPEELACPVTPASTLKLVSGKPLKNRLNPMPTSSGQKPKLRQSK